jgi:hypothetical protein
MKRAGLANRLIIVRQGTKNPAVFPEFSLTAGKKLRIRIHSSRESFYVNHLISYPVTPAGELAAEQGRRRRPGSRRVHL